MNLIFAIASLSLLASGTTAQGDVETNSIRSPTRRRHPHMWMFGENGVSIYTADGSEEVKNIAPVDVCKNVTSDDGSSRVRCDFNDVVSDGNKFVWASVARGVPEIDVFRIDTGDLVGSFPTCGSPGDMDVHPMREEIWVHCQGFSNNSDSHIDVFSTVSPTTPISTSIVMHDNTNLRASGKLAVHAGLGDVGYSTVSGQPYLYKLDLADRSVIEQYSFEEGNPKFYGLNAMVYSPNNGHLFARSEVCCTCGSEGADTLECGRYGSKNITISGETVEGQCGRHCQGGPVDNIGIIEFDTKTDTVVGRHEFVGSAPVYEPFISEDGKYIILAGLDGGQTVQMLEVGENGAKSKVARTLSLNFNTSNVEESNVYRDFTYIKNDQMNLFVLASCNDYQVAIVDMDNDFDVSYVSLKDIPYEGRCYSRQVEWVENSNYVWVAGRQQDETYVIDLSTKKLVKTFTESDARKLLSVAPHHFMGMADEYNNYFQANGALQGSSNAMSNGSSGDEGSNNALSITALAISIVAIAAVVASFFAAKQSPQSSGGVAKPESAVANSVTGSRFDDPSLAVAPSVA